MRERNRYDSTVTGDFSDRGHASAGGLYDLAGRTVRGTRLYICRTGVCTGRVFEPCRYRDTEIYRFLYLAELRRDYSYDFSHTVVPSLQSEGDIYDTYLVAQHDSIDMNETAISDLLLMLPTKMLCREDCKGLCDICGCNLNETTCDCRK